MYVFELSSKEINSKLSIARIKKDNPGSWVGLIDDIAIYSSAHIPEGSLLMVDSSNRLSWRR